MFGDGCNSVHAREFLGWIVVAYKRIVKRARSTNGSTYY